MIFLNPASSVAAAVHGVCTHTDTKGKQRKARVRNILKFLEKTQYLMNTLYLPLKVDSSVCLSVYICISDWNLTRQAPSTPFSLYFYEKVFFVKWRKIFHWWRFIALYPYQLFIFSSSFFFICQKLLIIKGNHVNIPSELIV